jgi:hypothetical protein
LFKEKNNAENQNQPGGRQAVQKDRIRPVHLFEVSPQSYSDDQDPQAKTLLEKDAVDKKERYERNSAPFTQWVIGGRQNVIRSARHFGI